MTETPRAARSSKMIAAAVIVGLMGSGAMVWQASSAAFTAQTESPGNSWDSGTVVLSDDKVGAMFTATNLVPGNTDTQCINIEYDGDVASTVKMYGDPGAVPDLGLAAYLAIDVSLATAGKTCATAVNGDYTRFYGDGNTVDDGGDDTLSEFLAAHTDYSTGTGSYVTPAAPNYVRAYRIKYTLIDDPAANDLDATGVDFIWEAQNN
jgi:hypothetical protein